MDAEFHTEIVVILATVHTYGFIENYSNEKNKLGNEVMPPQHYVGELFL